MKARRYDNLNSTVVTTEGKRNRTLVESQINLNSTVVTTEVTSSGIATGRYSYLNSTVVTTEDFSRRSVEHGVTRFKFYCSNN